MKFDSRRLFLISFIIAQIGVTLSMWGASWDITSHLLRTPETFFTPSHGVLYLGVGISVISAVLGLIFILTRKDVKGRSFVFGSKIIIVGSIKLSKWEEPIMCNARIFEAISFGSIDQIDAIGGRVISHVEKQFSLGKDGGILGNLRCAQV